MPNMSLKKNEMPSQEPNVRNKNFLEVALGYTEEQALDEAARCLNCKNHPCVSGCPVQVKIPEFIKKITEKDYEGAYQVIHETSSLPAVCGRVCPQETQCESKCIRGIKGENDFNRSERQRKLMEVLLNQVMQDMTIDKMVELITVAMPYVLTNLSASDMLTLGTQVLSSGIVSRAGRDVEVYHFRRLQCDRVPQHRP